MEYYENTIYDMPNEKDYYNGFELIHDFVKFLAYEVWDNNECLYETDYYKFLF